MILRDIYIELGEIFNFRYEKNSNGSYRVNTVISYLVYPSLYDDDNFTESDICYFLKNKDFTYQHYANIRNSFSELMNPKNNSNRFPVTTFAEMIDINEMYLYYKGLIDGLDSEKSDRLNKFIENLMNKEAVLYSKLKLICDYNHEFLTWIIIFSMFNKTVTDEKFQNFTETLQSSADYYSSDEVNGNDLSISLQKSASHQTMMTVLLVSSVCIQLLLAFAPQFILDRVSNWYYPCVFIYSFINIIIWIIQGLATHKLTMLKAIFHFKNIYNNFQEPYLDNTFKLKPHDSILEKRRATFRNIYFSVCVTLCILSLIPAVIVKSFPLFAGFLLLFLYIYICADRIVSSYLYRTFYDGLTHHGHCNQYRGMAKIYKWEYEKTGFNFKDKYYKNRVPVHNIECYKNIFYLAYDRHKWVLYDLYQIIFFTNIFFFLISLAIIFINDKLFFFRLPDNIDINLMIVLYITTVGVFFIITALCNKNYFTGLAYTKCALAHVHKNPSDSAKIYLTLQSENYLREIDVARGTYVYNVSLFEKGTLVENIFPESDRMLYYHQAVAFRNLLKISTGLIYAILFFLLVWHMQNYILFFPLTIIAIVTYIVFDRFIIERIHYRKILREIKKLSDSDESKSAQSAVKPE